MATTHETSVKQTLRAVAAELSATFESLDEAELEALRSELLAARRVFVAGAGRSLLMIRGLAMRLMHLGFTSYVVGETVTPAIEPGDVLVIASGSGSTGTLVVMAQKCKHAGARLALITTQESSPIGDLADAYVHVRAASTKVAANKVAAKSVQPGSNTFEQSVLIVGDCLVASLISPDDLAEKNDELMRRHANLE